jgi:hypothetical protein
MTESFDLVTIPGGKLLHSAFCIYPPPCGGWRGWKETNGAASMIPKPGGGELLHSAFRVPHSAFRIRLLRLHSKAGGAS